MFFGVRWRWALAAGAGVAFSTFTLVFFLSDVLYTALAITGWNEKLGEAGVTKLGRFIGVWVTPVFYLLLATGAVAWTARRFGSASVWQGLLVGLFSFAGYELIGLAFAPPTARELVVYPVLAVASGVLGSFLGRSMLEGRESFYRASQAIGAVRNPEDVAEAIGEHLAGPEVGRITLWSAEDGGSSFELLSGWTPRGEGWPSNRRLDAARLPALEDLAGQASRMVGVRELPYPERKAWEKQGVRSILLIPLAASDGLEGLLMVALRGNTVFTRGRVRTYQTIGVQAALALENLRLVEQARRSGVLGERQRLAFEIHDTLVQGFSGIVMNLETAEEALEADPERVRLNLNRARRTARESLAEARRMVWALRPEMLERASLSEALGRVVGAWAEAGDTEADLRVTGEPRPLPPEIEVTLLRAAQEALTNVRKHARAGRVVMTLSYMEDLVTLDARDDGVGFGPDEDRGAPGERASGGFGLRAMQGRAEQLGGTLLVESTPGGGTALMMELPATVTRGTDVVKETS